MELMIHDIINNMIDELERAREILCDNEDAANSMLLSDIESSLERASDLKERIEFALIIAVYVGMENAKIDFKHNCDSAEWRDKYLKAASEVELEYEYGLISSEWAYDTASYLARQMITAENSSFGCPLGGDETDDCADCAYSCDYHFVDGECIRREENE